MVHFEEVSSDIEGDARIESILGEADKNLQGKLQIIKEVSSDVQRKAGDVSLYRNLFSRVSLQKPR